MRLEDMRDGYSRMRIGVALEHTLPSARAAGLSHRGRKDYLVAMLRLEGLSEDELAIGLEYVERHGRLSNLRTA